MPNTDRIGIVTLYITIYTSFPKLRGIGKRPNTHEKRLVCKSGSSRLGYLSR